MEKNRNLVLNEFNSIGKKNNSITLWFGVDKEIQTFEIKCIWENLGKSRSSQKHFIPRV